MDKELIDPEYRKICSEKTLQTNSKGFFLNFVEIISENAGENWIRNIFGKLKTDKERIREIFTFEEVSTCIGNIIFIYKVKYSFYELFW